MTDKPATLHAAMALAFAEIDGAVKGAENPAFKQGGKALKYANINAVIEAIKPALINHGLWFTQNPTPHDRGVQIETMLHHASGESMSLGSLFVPASKQDAQGFGSAMTYARRYALVTAFGVPVEDDDGNAAVAATRNAPEPAPEPPAKREGPPKTHLDAAEKRMVREIEGCGDADMLDIYLKTEEAKADYNLLNKYQPHSINGPHPDNLDGFISIADRIKAKRDAFARAAYLTA